MSEFRQSHPESDRKRGRPRTGGLFRRGAQWYARFSGTKDGETVRLVRALGTDSKQVAKAKLARLLGQELPPDDASRGETFAEAAMRIIDGRKAAGKNGWHDRQQRFESHILPVLGSMSVADIRARHLNDLLENVRVVPRGMRTPQRPAPQTLKNILSDISVVLDDLWRKDVILENAARKAILPECEKAPKERAVLSDFELARYLKWQHPDERAQPGVLERQTMSCIARLLGGVRTGDMHSMRWESLDAANGRFEWGYAPRSKTKQPQRLAIDPMLRPVLLRWWERSGRPRTGLAFPALVDGEHSKAGEGQKHQVSHAEAFRRDLRRAFGVEELRDEQLVRSNGRGQPISRWVQVRDLTPREQELFEEGEHTLPVDFHSWRRAYCQSLADAGVNAQLAKALAGHATESAHDRYVRSSGKARALPEAARPKIDISKVISGHSRVGTRKAAKK